MDINFSVFKWYWIHIVYLPDYFVSIETKKIIFFEAFNFSSSMFHGILRLFSGVIKGVKLSI